MSFDPSNGFNPAAHNGLAGSGLLPQLDDSLPIFNIEPVQLQFSVAADFVAAQVANNVIILALSNGRVLRIDLNRPEDIDGELRRHREKGKEGGSEFQERREG